MKNLRSRFERFCYRNREKGIPNLMLYVTLGSAIVYLLSLFDQSYTLYSALCFDRALILQGCEMLGMDIRDVAGLCIAGMKAYAAELGLGPKAE